MKHFLFTNTPKIKNTWNLQDGSTHKNHSSTNSMNAQRIYLALYLTEVTKLSDWGDQVTQLSRLPLARSKRNVWPLKSFFFFFLGNDGHQRLIRHILQISTQQKQVFHLLSEVYTKKNC